MLEQNIIDVEEKNQKKTEGPNPKKIKVIILSTLIIVSAISICIFLPTFLKSKNSEPKIEHKSPFKSIMQINSNPFRFPFALDFALNEVKLMPKPFYHAFEKLPTFQKRKESMTKSYFSNYTLESERKIEFGIDIGKLLLELIIGKSFDFFNFDMEFKDYQKTKKLKVAVNHFVKLYEIKLDDEKITLKKKFIELLSEILNDAKLNKTEKVNKLIELFDQYGYFVPLEMDLGGRFIYTFEESNLATASEISLALMDILSAKGGKDISYYLSKISVFYIGGEKISNFFNFTDIQKWTHSLNEDNIGIINYKNIVKISEFFPKEIQNLYKEYSADVDKRYSILKEKYDILKHYSDVKVPTEKIDQSETAELKYGADENTKYIKEKKISIFREAYVAHSSDVTVRYDVQPKQVIVGIKIVEKRQDDHGGYWTAEHNPITQKSVEIKFESRTSREQKWDFYIYYLDFN